MTKTKTMAAPRAFNLPFIDPAEKRRCVQARTFVKRTLSLLPVAGDGRNLFIDALAGGSALSAMRAQPAELRGRALVSLLLAGVHPAQMKGAIQCAWVADDPGIRRHMAAEGIPLLSVFEAADFPLPADMPESFVVWRGTAGINKATAENGLSWTPSREAACIYATDRMYKLNTYDNGLLLRRLVNKRDVIAYLEHPDCDELMINGNVDSHIDGYSSDILRVVIYIAKEHDLDILKFPLWCFSRGFGRLTFTKWVLP